MRKEVRKNEYKKWKTNHYLNTKKRKKNKTKSTNKTLEKTVDNQNQPTNRYLTEQGMQNKP